MYKRIKEFPEYFINESGVVVHQVRGFVRTFISKDGYYLCKLRKDGKYFERVIHRLLAIEFIPNPFKKPTVNHIDGVKTNNSLDNLEWATHKEQMYHANDNNLMADHLKFQPVDVFDFTSGQFIKTYDSQWQACRDLGLKSNSKISNCIAGTRKQYCGYIFRSADKP